MLKRLQTQNVRNNERFPIPRATADEIRKVQSGEADARLVRKVARHFVALFSDVAEDQNQGAIVTNIMRMVEQRIGGNPNLQGRALFKKEILDACDQFLRDEGNTLKPSTYCKINMVAIIDKLNQVREPEGNGVRTLIALLDDTDRHSDGVYFLVLDSLIRARQNSLTTVSQERQIATKVYNLGTRPWFHPMLLDKICETLGVMEVAFTGNVPDRAEVAQFLASVALDQSKSMQTRVEAAVALGRLRSEQVTNWNGSTQAWVIGKVMLAYAEWAKTNLDSDKPEASAARLRWHGARLYQAAKTAESKAINGKDRLTELLTRFRPIVEEVFDKKPPESDNLSQWVDDNKVNEIKLGSASVAFAPEQPAKPPATASK
jgi:hypothetical protein